MDIIKLKPNEEITKNQTMKIYSLNVGGLNSKYDLGILNGIIKEYDVLCFSETKTNFITNYMFPNFKPIEMPKKIFNHKFGGIHGLCIYLREELYDTAEIMTNDTKSESVLWCKINSKVSKTSFFIGAVYIPHEASKYHHKELFENVIHDITVLKNKFDIPTLLIGDFNARVGNLNDFEEIDGCITNISGFDIEDDGVDLLDFYDIPLNRVTKDMHVNENGKRLINLCKISNFKIMNGRIGRNGESGEFTCITGMGKSTVDYVVASPCLIPFIDSFRIDPYDRCISDTHSGLSLSLNISGGCSSKYISLNKNETHNQGDSLDFQLKWDEMKSREFANSFDITLISEFEEAIKSLKDTDINSTIIEKLCNDLSNIFIDNAKKSGLYKNVRNTITRKTNKVKVHKPWFDNECIKARKTYLNKKKILQRNGSNDNLSELKRECIKYNQLIKHKKKTFQNDTNRSLREQRTKNPRDFWSFINKRKMHSNKISMDCFKAHFEGLNNEINVDTEPFDEAKIDLQNDQSFNDLFSFIEVRNHIKSLNNNKACGFDQILNEHLKNCPDSLIKLITEYFNLILESGIVPSNWCVGMIQPIYKRKGDERDPDNYRGITLISSIGKLFTSCLNSRLTAFLETNEIITENQVGFRKGYSTMDHIFTLHTLLEFYLQRKKRIYAAFIDYRKAFDLVNRTSLWTKLLSNQIDGKILRAIINIYEKTKTCVKLGNNISQFFPCKIGVRQGDNLSPLLFAIYLNDFNDFLSTKFDGLKELSQEVNRTLNNSEVDTYLKLYTLLYADDTVILAESETELQKALDALELYCKLWQLQVNLDKTKIIIFSRGKVTKFGVFSFGGNPIEVVSEYLYLGVVMNYNNKFSKAIEKQILLARKALFALNAKILEYNLPIDIQIKLFDTLILPILTYGCEIWGFSELNSLETFHRQFIKSCLKISKSASKSITYGESGVQNIENIINTRMICFWNRIRQGHNNKFSFKMLNFVKNLQDQNIYHSKWCTKIRHILDSTGLSYV